eukprot:COSAG02_NODE_2402_length_8943_cov_2.854138_13_plen_100_part_00
MITKRCKGAEQQQQQRPPPPPGSTQRRRHGSEDKLQDAVAKPITTQLNKSFYTAALGLCVSRIQAHRKRRWIPATPMSHSRTTSSMPCSVTTNMPKLME